MTDPTVPTATMYAAGGFVPRLGRGICWRLIAAEIAEDAVLGCRLTYADLQPPTGTIVEDGHGRAWERCGDIWRGDGDAQTSWLQLTSPEMAPVRIIQHIREVA